jgi:multimeric flavodoxin WrbA
VEVVAVKIVVLNGSPKGNMSVTLQYVLFIRKKFPHHELKIFNIAQEIRKIEGEEEAFQEIIEAVKSADGVLWAFPLYFLLVHSHYKRFIELIWERKAESAFQNKYAASLSTSIHFFDHTAHNYINAVCDDLNMRFVGAFSADMYDLLQTKEQDKLIRFAEHFFGAIESNILTSKNFRSLVHRNFDYVPGHVGKKIDVGGKKVLILTDSDDGHTNLGRMIEKFKSSFSSDVEVVNLNSVDIKGGCLGCIKCGYDNTCVYQDKDGYAEFFTTKVKAADVLVFAGTIKDRYLSSRWKLFFDRSFFYGHAPKYIGKQLGFIISGPLSQIPNLRQIMEAYAEGEGANMVDFVTDEYESSAEINALLQSLAERLIRFASESYMKSFTFLGVGGRKLFRDEIWGRLRPSFAADYRFYQKHGMYDFPQKDYKTRLIVGIFMLLEKLPAFRKEYVKRTKAEMIKPLQKIVEKS